MLCYKFEKIVSNYIDGVLPEQERLHWDDHLKVCQRCRSTLKQTKKMIKSLSTLPAIEPSSEFHRKLRHRIAQDTTLQKKMVKRSLLQPHYISITVLFLLMVCSGVIYYNIKDQGLSFDKSMEQIYRQKAPQAPVESVPNALEKSGDQLGYNHSKSNTPQSEASLGKEELNRTENKGKIQEQPLTITYFEEIEQDRETTLASTGEKNRLTSTAHHAQDEELTLQESREGLIKPMNSEDEGQVEEQPKKRTRGQQHHNGVDSQELQAEPGLISSPQDPQDHKSGKSGAAWEAEQGELGRSVTETPSVDAPKTAPAPDLFQDTRRDLEITRGDSISETSELERDKKDTTATRTKLGVVSGRIDNSEVESTLDEDHLVNPAQPGMRQYFNLSQDMTPPQKIAGENPAYPASVISSKISCQVKMEARIDTKGNVVDATILEACPTHPELFNQAALDTIKTWKFKPALKQGQPVPVRYGLTISFTPERE